MWELIVAVGLQLVRWIFDKSKDKEKIAKLISQWMIVMRKKFLSSADTKADFEDLWKKAESETEWTETK